MNAHVFKCVKEDITGCTQAYGVLYNTLVTAAVNGKVEVHAKKHLCWEMCYSILVFEWVVSIKADITNTSQTNHAISVSHRAELQMKSTDGNSFVKPWMKSQSFHQAVFVHINHSGKANEGELILWITLNVMWRQKFFFFFDFMFQHILQI